MFEKKKKKYCYCFKKTLLFIDFQSNFDVQHFISIIF